LRYCIGVIGQFLVLVFSVVFGQRTEMRQN
jgi:hypothetical protein